MNIVYLLIISIVLSQDCDVNQNQFSIYAQTNETMFYSLDSLFSGNNLQYSIDDSFKNDISVIKQLNLLQKEIYHSRIATQEIKSKKAYISENGYFLNDFMFMDQDEASVYITYSQGNHNFSNYVQISKQNEIIFCYDSDYIKKDIFVVDCTKQIDNQFINLFYLIQSTTQTYAELIGEKISNKPNNRKILVSNEQLYRISMDDQLSTISLFQIQDGQLTNNRLYYVDKAEIEKSLETVLKSFTIKDAQISNSTLYVLEQDLGILEFQFHIWLGIKITVHPPATISQALTFSISNQRQIVIYENSFVFYSNFVSQYEIYLPFRPIWGKVESKFAGEFIILNQNYLTYIYFHKNYVATEYINIETLLANPNIPEIIGINNEYSMKFSVSKGYLKFNPHSQSTQFVDQMMLYASNSKKLCQITLYFKVIENNDNKIYQLEDSLFPNTIWYPTNAIQLNTISIGPNMEFSNLQEEDDIKLEFSDLYNMKLDFLPKLEQISYFELHESHNKFRIFLQINNGTTLIYKMNEQTFQIDSQSIMPILPVSNSLIVWSELSSQLKYFYKATEYSINHYSQGKILQSIQYPNTIQNRIFSFAVSEDQSSLYILQTYLSRVEVLQFREFETIKTIIDKELLGSQGYFEEFIPKQLFILKEIVFIKTEIAILMFHSSEGNNNLYNKIEINKGAYIELLIGTDNCIIVQKLQQQDSIQVYNYQNPSINIMKIKELSLYNHKIQYPIQVVNSQNYFCVRAVNEEDKTVILMYSIHSLAHQSLRKIFSLDFFVPEGEYLQMSISEGSYLYLFVNFNSGYKMWKLELNPSVQFKISPESLDYVKQYLMGIGVENQFSSLEIYKKIQFIDSHISIAVNETLFPSIFNINRNIPTTIALNSTWFTGQIVKFNIYSKYQPEYTNVIKIQNYIDQQTDAKYFQYADLTDSAVFDDLTLIFQGPKSLVFAYKSGSLKFEHDFTMKMGLDCVCNKFVVQSETIISSCFDNQGSKYILIHECNQFGCETNMNQRLLNVNEVGKMKLINNFLFVLHTNINDPRQYEGTIDIYQISEKQLIYMTSINSKYLGSDKSVYISDFDIVPFTVKNKNYYKLVLVDIQNGFWQMDMTESLNMLSPEQYNLGTLLDSVNLYSNSLTNFLQMRVIETETTKTTISISLIVTTNNLMHFRMFIQFDGSNMKFGSSIIKKSGIVQTVFNNYFDWECMNSLSLIYTSQLGGKMSVVYRSKSKQQSILVVYEIGISQNDTVQFKGGLELEQEQYNNDRIIIMDNENERIMLYSNFERSKIYKEHLVLKYEILKEMQIVFENKYSVNEWMVIEVSNNFMGKSFDKWFQYRLI